MDLPRGELGLEPGMGSGTLIPPGRKVELYSSCPAENSPGIASPSCRDAKAKWMQGCSGSTTRVKTKQADKAQTLLQNQSWKSFCG